MKKLLAALWLLLLASPCAAQTSSLSKLNAGAAISTTDIFYDVQTTGVGGVKITGTQLMTYIFGQVSGSCTSDSTGLFNCGTAGSPGGSTGQVQFNSSGAFSGDSGFTYLAGGQATLALGSITTSKQAINATATYNASGTTFDGTALLINITNTASPAGGSQGVNGPSAIDIRVGGNSAISVKPTILAPGSFLQIGDGSITGFDTQSGGLDIGSTALWGCNAPNSCANDPLTSVQGFQYNWMTFANGTRPTLSGCSFATQLGSQSAGWFTAGVTGTCTVTINPFDNSLIGYNSPGALPLSTSTWICFGFDQTHPAQFTQTAATSTSCTISGSTTNGDTIVFWMFGT